MDTLKFERMFMWQLETNQKSEPIVECLIKAADKLGKRLIAEGVETQRQLDILAKFGCEYQQGYYYAPTIPKELLADVLGKSMDGDQNSAGSGTGEAETVIKLRIGKSTSLTHLRGVLFVSQERLPAYKPENIISILTVHTIGHIVCF